MTKFIGRRGSLGIAIEATRGTPVAPTYWIPATSISFRDMTETQREEQGLGNIADSDSNYVTFRGGEGDVEAQLYDKGLGYILTSLLGAAPNTTGSNPYTHTYTLSQTNLAKSLTLAWQDPNQTIIFPMATVDSLEINVEPNGIVEYTVGFKSKSSRDWSTLTPDYTSVGSKFLHQHVQFKLADTVGGLAAATSQSLKNLELTLSRNTEFDRVTGTVEAEDIISQQLSVEGTVELNYEDNTYRNYMLNGSYKALELYLFRSSSSSLQIQMPRVDFSEWETDFDNNEIVKQSINIKGNYDAANGLQIVSTAVLTNTKPSY